MPADISHISEVQPVAIPPAPRLGGTSPRDFAEFGELAAERSRIKAEGYRRIRLAEWLEAGPEPAEMAVSDAPSILIQESKVSTSDFSSTYEQIIARSGRYGRCHQRSESMSDYLFALDSDFSPEESEIRGYGWMATKLRDCGRQLIFRGYPDVAETRLHAGWFCQYHLLCPLCALRRAAKVLRAYCGKILQIVYDTKTSCYMVTFTVRSGPDLAERFEHLRKALQRLHQNRNRYLASLRAGYKKKQRFTQAAHAEGALWSYEIKRGSGTGLWHPHVHAVWLCREQPDAERLAREWHDLTGDSYILDVRPFRSELLEDAELALTALGGDLAEVVKYALKMSDMPLADNLHAHELLRGKRLMGTFGALRGVKVDPSNLDAPLEPDDLPYVEYVARWLDEGGRYDLTRNDGDTWHGSAGDQVSPLTEQNIQQMLQPEAIARAKRLVGQEGGASC